MAANYFDSVAAMQATKGLCCPAFSVAVQNSSISKLFLEGVKCLRHLPEMPSRSQKVLQADHK
jgi:hypothetical protein